MSNNRANGIFTAAYTPMDDKGRIIIENIEPIYDRLKSSGVSGVLINGTTGEGMSLSPDEKVRIAEKWNSLAGSDPDFRLFVNVSSDSSALSRELVLSLKGLNISGVFCHSTSFFKPEKMEDLLDFCGEVAQEDTKLPFYFYYIPVFTNVRFSMYRFMQAAQKRIKNFAGIKFTDFNVMDFTLCNELDNGKYDVFMGLDESYLPFSLIGAKAFIGSSYNYMPLVYKRINEYIASGDIKKAKSEYMFVLNVFSLFSDYGVLASGKAIMKMTGIDCGSMRPPCSRLSQAQYTELQARLKAMNFFERIR